MPKNKKRRSNNKNKTSSKGIGKHSHVPFDRSIRSGITTTELRASDITLPFMARFKSPGKFKRYEGNTPKLKTLFNAVKIIRFEAEKQSKLFVTLENDEALSPPLFGNALQAAILGPEGAAIQDPFPDEIIVQAEAEQEEIETQLRETLAALEESTGDASLEITNVEEEPSKKRGRTRAFSFSTRPAKRPRTAPDEDEDEKETALPMTTFGRTGGDKNPKVSGKGSSDSSESGSGRGTSGDGNKRDRKGERTGAGGNGDDDGDDPRKPFKKGKGEHDDPPKKRKKKKTEKDREENDETPESAGDDAEGRKRGRAGARKSDKRPKKTKTKAEVKKVHQFFGVTVNNLSDDELKDLEPTVENLYSEHTFQTELLKDWGVRASKIGLEKYTGKPIADQTLRLQAPSVIIAELSTRQIEEILAASSNDDFRELLAKYKKAKDPGLYLAALLHHANANKKWLGDREIIIADLMRQIFAPAQGRDVEQIIKDTLATWKPTFDIEEKRATVLAAVESVRHALEILKRTEDYPENTGLVLNEYSDNIKRTLKEDAGKLLMALYDYANTEFGKYSAIDTPWQINDLEQAYRILAAQLALSHTVMQPVPADSWVFRWKSGDEPMHHPGTLISPMALWSCSRGSMASEGFGKKEEDLTFFAIQKPRSGRFIQLVTGTNKWYQREVLFPAHAQFVVKSRFEFNAGRKDKKGIPLYDVGYVLEEVEGGVQQLLTDDIPNIGLPAREGKLSILPPCLLASLVDARHRKLFEGAKTLTGAQLETAGIELNGRRETDNIPLESIYGEETHKAWSEIMQTRHPRRDILTLKVLKECFLGLKTRDKKGALHKDAIRDFETGWGEFQTLNAAQRQALKAHGLLVYPTLEASSEELNDYIKWVRKRSFGQPIQSIKGRMGKKNYLESLDEKLREIKSLESQLTNLKRVRRTTETVKQAKDLEEQLAASRVAIPDEHMVSFLHETRQIKQIKDYNADTQKYEVSYGHPISGQENVMLTDLNESLDEFSIALEQSLALYVGQHLSQQEYVAAVYRLAAFVQQALVAAHPFTDGNGRLSRLIMYKVLMAYLPVGELQKNGLPIVAEPGKDLLTEKEAWAQILVESQHIPVTTATSTQPGTPSGDDLGKGDGDKTGDTGGSKPGDSGTGGSNTSGSNTGNKDGDSQKQQPRQTYDASDASGRRLQVFTTSGSGNCGIHAVNGSPNRNGVFAADNHAAIRRDLSREVFERRNGPHRERFIFLLNALLIQIGSTQRLGQDMLALWKNMNSQIPGLPQLLKNVWEKSQTTQTDMQKRLEDIKIAIASLLLDGQETTHALRNLLRGEILKSNAINVVDLKEPVRNVTTHEEFIQLLLQLETSRLRELVFENLHLLMDKLPESAGQIQLDYAQYQAEATATQSPFRAFTEAHFDALMRAYSDSVAIEGYYLRDEDLRVLADMSQRGLVIYVADRDHRDRFVEAVNHNPQNYENVIEVFHQGDHYERAILGLI